jgi:hypothetical protein
VIDVSGFSAGISEWILIYHLARRMPPRNTLELNALYVGQGAPGCADIKQGMAKLLKRRVTWGSGWHSSFEHPSRGLSAGKGNRVQQEGQTDTACLPKRYGQIAE